MFEDNVDVGANSSVDRGTLGNTKIGEFTKIDSLVQIGHNNKIGKRSLICGMTGIGGSCNIGDDVTLGGHSGLADHLNIASGVRAGGKSAFAFDIDSKGDYMGHPAVPVKDFWKQVSALSKLTKMARRLRVLEKKLEK